MPDAGCAIKLAWISNQGRETEQEHPGTELVLSFFEYSATLLTSDDLDGPSEAEDSTEETGGTYYVCLTTTTAMRPLLPSSSELAT